MPTTKTAYRHMFEELERKCHSMLSEMKTAIEDLDGEALVHAFDEITDRYGA